MADIKISELAAAGAVSDAMLLEAATAGLVNNKITIAQLSDKIINTDLGVTTTLANAIQTTNATVDGLAESTTTITSPASNQFQLTEGITDLLVTNDCTINQDLSTTSDVTFNKVTSGDGYFTGKLTVDGLVDPTGFVATPQASPPTTTDGTIYYDSPTNEFRFRENGVWNVLSASTGSPNEANIYYVRSNGSDSNTGLNIGDAFLTIQKGIDTADLQSPSATNQYVVRIADGGAYDSFTLGSKPYISINASGANLLSTGGSYILGNSNSITFDRAGYASSGGLLITKGGSGTSYLKGNSISGTTIGLAIEVTSGSLYADVKVIDIVSTSDAIATRNGTLLDLLSQKISGNIVVQSVSTAHVIVNELVGNIVVGDNSTLYITINGNFSGNITAGANSIVRVLVGTRSAFTDSIDPLADFKIYYIGESASSVDEANIYYVRSNGSDSNTGLNIENAFLTLQKSIDTAELQLPTISNQFTVKVFDSGTYLENILISKPYVHLDAKNARIANLSFLSPIFDISYTDSGYTYIDFAELYGSTGVIPACRINTPNAVVHLRIKNNYILQTPPIRIEGGTTFLSMDNCESSAVNCLEVTGGAFLYANILNTTGSILVGDNSKAFIKMNSNFTGFITAGVNSRLTLVCASRELLYLDSIDPTAQVRIIETDKEAEPEQNILYVDLNGDDNRSGKRLKDSLLTWSKAISEAEIDASLGNQYNLVSDASSTYSEDITISKPYVHVYSPNIIFNTTTSSKITVSHALSGYTFLTYGKIRGGGSASNPAFLINVPSGSVYLYAKEMENNISPIINLEAGDLYVQADYINNTAANSLALVASGSTLYCNALKATGNINVQGTIVYRLGSLDGNIIVSANGKANIFIGGTFTGSVIVGANAELTLSCHERTTIGSDSIDATSTTSIFEFSQEAKPEENIYYVESFGNDLRDGKRIQESFATYGKAISEISADSPSISDQVTIHSNSSKIYTEQNSISSSYTHINTPDNVLRSPLSTGHTLNLNGGTGDNNLRIKEISANSVGNALNVNIDATSALYLDAGMISNTGAGYGIGCTDGYTLGNIKDLRKLFVGANGEINLTINKSIGDIFLDDGSAGSLIIGKRVSGTITKGSFSSVNILDLTDGLGIPFMTQSQRLALTPTTLSFFVYDTTEGIIYSYQNSSWFPLISGGVEQDTPNILVGGDYSVNPRQSLPNGSTLTTDDTYVADNTILLSDGNNIVQVSEVEYRGLSFRTTAANKQFGVLIPVEQLDSAPVLQSEIASLAIRARWSGIIGTRNIRVALLSWIGVGDSITSDVVATWQGAGSNPILATNWSYVNTPSNLPLVSAAPSSWQTFKIEGFSVGTTNVRNLAVFVWVDDVVIGTVEQLDISNIKLTNSYFAGGFHPREAAEELLLCQRYYAKSVDVDVDPFTPTVSGSATVFKSASTISPTLIGMNVDFPATMLSNSAITPVLTPFSTATGTSGNVRNNTTSSDITASGTSVSGRGGKIQLSTGLNTEAQVSYQWVADARL